MASKIMVMTVVYRARLACAWNEIVRGMLNRAQALIMQIFTFACGLAQLCYSQNERQARNANDTAATMINDVSTTKSELLMLMAKQARDYYRGHT